MRSAKHFIPLDQVDRSLIWRERTLGSFQQPPRHEVCSIWLKRTFMVPFRPEVTISGNGLLQCSQWKSIASSKCKRAHILYMLLVTCADVCVTELEWPREAACAGWVDRQLWAHAGETHDAGDRTAVSKRLHLTAAQRGKYNLEHWCPFICPLTQSSTSWLW